MLVDAVYEGGTAKNLGSEVLSKVMHVGNSGGFRPTVGAVGFYIIQHFSHAFYMQSMRVERRFENAKNKLFVEGRL